MFLVINNVYKVLNFLSRLNIYVNNKRNNNLYAKYAELAQKQDKVIFGGRLGQYKYYNMDQVIEAALDAVNNEFSD